MTWLDVALRAQPLVAAFFILVFVGVYQWKSKWWKTAIGRHMMTFMAGLGVVLIGSFVSRYFGVNPKINGFISWNIVILLMAWRAWVAIRILVIKNWRDRPE